LAYRHAVATGTTSAFEGAAAAVAGGADPQAEAAALVAQMTADERLWCLDGDLPFWAGLGDLGTGGYHKRPFPAARVERLGIPGFAFSDGPRGIVIGPATCFPVSMARGATFDVDLEERIGEAIGQELRAVGATLYGGVCVNVLRHPAWGRAQETYGEDPHHVGEMGAALTRGVQRHAMACVKHFACNSMENARFKVDVTVDEQALHEVYLPHFRRIVEEGVASVMSAYNAVNGEWCGQSGPLLTDVLRTEWGFEGFVISDWIFGLRDAGPSLAAGLDVEMPYRMFRATGLPAALEAGEASDDDVTAAAVRLIATLLRFDPILRRPPPPMAVLASPAHRALAREAATKSIVLLRNEPVAGAPLLPLARALLERVAVLGRLAAIRNLGDGGSSDVWAPEAVTPLEGLRAALEGAEVAHDDGSDLDRAAQVAATADVAVVIVGYTREDEGEFIGSEGTASLAQYFPGPDDPELAARFTASIAADPGPEPPADLVSHSGGFSTGGDRASLRLRPEDEALIGAVAAANPRTVVAIVAGSAVVARPWLDAVPAVVQGWYAGMEGGHALADVLLGVADASGRLPFTVPVEADHLPPFEREADAVVYDEWHGWWMLERDGNTPEFPFGFGLSYTSFNLGPCSAGVNDGGDIVVWATVANTGGRDGADVLQLYGGREGARRRLLGFARTEVPAGSRTDLEIVVPRSQLARRDTQRHQWVVEPGRYRLEVAHHAADPHAASISVDVA
jgi:beta-glucosidase